MSTLWREEEMNIDLRLGDCVKILPTLASKSVDAIITDLPYGTTDCKWDVIIPFDIMWREIKRLCKGAFITTAGQPFTSMLILSNLPWFKYELIWDKNYGTAPGLAKYRPMPSHENIVVFGNGHMTYNPQMEEGKPYKDIRKNGSEIRNGGRIQNEHKLGYKKFVPVINTGTRHPLSVRKVQKYNRKGQHPTEKPLELYEWLVNSYTNPGDTVLDFCMGSGTTGRACKKLERNFIGIELDPDYFEDATTRMEME
jgi:DNA modification methylase